MHSPVRGKVIILSLKLDMRVKGGKGTEKKRIRCRA